MAKCQICGKYIKNGKATHDFCETIQYAKTFKVAVIATHEGLCLKQNLSKDEISYCLRYVNQDRANEINQEIGLTA